MTLEAVGINSQNNTAAPSNGQPVPGADRLYAGKYRTVEELEKGYGNLLTAGNQIIDKNREMEGRLNALMPLLDNQGSNPNRSQPAGGAPPRGQALLALAAATNVDPDQLRLDLLGIADERVAPISGAIAASQIVERDVPDFSKHRGEIAHFLASHPEVNARVTKMSQSGDPELIAAAADYATGKWMNFASNAGTTRIDASGQEQANARLDAVIPAAGSGGRDIANVSDYTAQMNAAVALGRASGRRDGPAWDKFLNLALGDTHGAVATR